MCLRFGFIEFNSDTLYFASDMKLTFDRYKRNQALKMCSSTAGSFMERSEVLRYNILGFT